jgi:hypothetical protein
VGCVAAAAAAGAGCAAHVDCAAVVAPGRAPAEIDVRADGVPDPAAAHAAAGRTAQPVGSSTECSPRLPGRGAGDAVRFVVLLGTALLLLLLELALLLLLLLLVPLTIGAGRTVDAALVV